MGELVRELEQRRAYRAMAPTAIASDVVDRVMSAATLAPSCSNKQPWRFVAVTDPDMLNRIRDAFSPGNYWAKPSPFVVLACTKADLDCRLSDNRDYAPFDTGMAVQSMMLQGVKEGLYTHPIAGFDPVRVKEAAGIPADVTLIALVVFAYQGDISALGEKHRESEVSQRSRKPLSDVVAENRWPDAWKV